MAEPVDTRTPVEVTTKYATTCTDLPEAWAFVMEHLDDVGPDPSIEIKPVWTVTDDTDYADMPRHFEVEVSGTVERPRP